MLPKFFCCKKKKKTHCERVNKRTQWCTFMLVKRTSQQRVFVLFTDECRFTLESDSGSQLIWRKQCTRYNQSHIVERHSYKGDGIMVWAGISRAVHIDLHVFHGGTLTGVRYRDEILDQYVHKYAAAIGPRFLLMDNNA
ncbi:hypothetical protein X975_13060, partial [Stegodyphus mimosarum]